jgi:hypothetical protein
MCWTIRGKSAAPRAMLIAGTCLVFGAYSGVDASLAQGMYYGRTTDPTPVELSLQDTDSVVTFIIPKVYLTYSGNWKGGPQSIIVMETIFPSMAPLSATRNNMLGRDVLTIRAKSYASTGAKHSTRYALQWSRSSQWALVDSFSDSKMKKFLST